MRAQSDAAAQAAEPRLDGDFVGRLRINSHQRLGATRAQKHPAPIGEVELETVVRADPFDLDARDLARFMALERAKYPDAILLVRLAVQVDVVSRVSVRADPFLEPGNDLRHRVPGLGLPRREHQADQDGVPPGDAASN